MAGYGAGGYRFQGSGDARATRVRPCAGRVVCGKDDDHCPSVGRDPDAQAIPKLRRGAVAENMCRRGSGYSIRHVDLFPFPFFLV